MVNFMCQLDKAIVPRYLVKHCLYVTVKRFFVLFCFVVVLVLGFFR